MKIHIEEMKPLGGIEVVVDELINCPIWLEGDLTDYTDGSVEMTINEMWLCLTDDWKKRADNHDYCLIHSMLSENGFFEQVISEVERRQI